MSSILPLNPSGNVLSVNDAHLPAGSGSVPGVCLSGFEPTTLPPPYLLLPDRRAARECACYGRKAAGDSTAVGEVTVHAAALGRLESIDGTSAERRAHGAADPGRCTDS